MNFKIFKKILNYQLILQNRIGILNLDFLPTDFDIETKEIYISKNPQFQIITIENISSLCNTIKENLQKCSKNLSENYQSLIENLKILAIMIDKGSCDPTPAFHNFEVIQYLFRFLSGIIESREHTEITFIVIQTVLHFFYEILFVVPKSRPFFLGINLAQICSVFVHQNEINPIFIFSLHILFLMNHFGCEYHETVIKNISYLELTHIFFDHIQPNDSSKKIPKKHLSSYINGFGHFFADICQYSLPPEQTSIITSCLLFLLTTEIESSYKYTFLGISRLIKQGSLSIEEYSQMDINSDLYQAININDPNDVEYAFDLLSSLFSIGWMQIDHYNSLSLFNLIIKWKNNLRTVELAFKALLQAIKIQPAEYSQPLYNTEIMKSFFSFLEGTFGTKKMSFQIIINLVKKNPNNSLKWISDDNVEKITDFYEIFLDQHVFHLMISILDMDDDEIVSELIIFLINFFKWCELDPIRIERFKIIFLDEKNAIDESIDLVEDSLSESSRYSLLTLKQYYSSIL